MLCDLRVRELGVIEELDLRFDGGLTVITGETGAGKTLIVDTLELLCGGKFDAGLVRTQASQAEIEARFIDNEDEHVVSRTLPREGRARSELNAHLVSTAVLEELGSRLVDLHGQHSQQSLLRPAVQRACLDRFGEIDLSEIFQLRKHLSECDRELGALGGDATMRAREHDLLDFELREIESAAIVDEDEDHRLEDEEDQLASVVALREAAEHALTALEGAEESSATDRLGEAIASLTERRLLAEHESRFRALHAEMIDATGELRRASEQFEEDPNRLALVRERRQELIRLKRKFGDTLADVLQAAASRRDRLELIISAEGRVQALEKQRESALEALGVAEQHVGDARRIAAPEFSRQVERYLHELALPAARFEVHVDGTALGDEVEFRLSTNVGEPPANLAKVASGGELARSMLALRLVLTSGPPTLIFDEVDAGIGGEAALRVGEALAALGRDHQVLVVTHLAQVAAFADTHIVVGKTEANGRTTASAFPVQGTARMEELARMLSGHPDSTIALRHATELFDRCQNVRDSKAESSR